ncbi:heterokaryon incompatibility protein-domain-containing protein [Lasiosphaeria ovina]|uniref:Heterokaryon incompatibility protein-domain-containing protein n=1 Tax=Lasiosphaeria ovina TaxID=92902 RepID=A0AAE0JY60_9PEZI|nr:heterokaryon incompatibility protein-domain-containing protein [Lasiosphaeria ovina]
MPSADTPPPGRAITGKTGSAIYQPLLNSADFRYLVLQPGRNCDDLVCTLHVASLESAPPFDAISYVWGSDEKNQKILCNGERVRITTNLRAALLRVRKPDQPRTLWADSICINQEDVEERFQQVSLMAQIYTKAETVLAHVGDDDGGHAPAASSLITEIGTMIQNTLATLDYSHNCFPFPGKEQHKSILADKRLDSLKALTTTPWFGRGWVVQEVGLAKEAVILWGSAEISWSMLMQCHTWVMRRTDVDWRYFGDLCDIHVGIFDQRWKTKLKSFYVSGAWQNRPDLWNILRHARLLGIKDERDRLYAFVPLFNSIAPPDAAVAWESPGYTAPYLKVYSDFAHSHPSIPQHGILAVKGVLFDRIWFRSEPLKPAETIDTIASIWQRLKGDHTPTTAASPYGPAHITLAFMMALCTGMWCGDAASWTAKCDAYMAFLGGSARADHRAAAAQLQDFANYYTYNRRIVATERGYFGMAPLTAREGDVCAVVFGARTPLVLRETDTQGRYKVVGEVWIPGRTVAKNYVGMEVMYVLGRDGSKDWVALGLDEEEILLC